MLLLIVISIDSWTFLSCNGKNPLQMAWYWHTSSLFRLTILSNECGMCLQIPWDDCQGSSLLFVGLSYSCDGQKLVLVTDKSWRILAWPLELRQPWKLMTASRLISAQIQFNITRQRMLKWNICVEVISSTGRINAEYVIRQAYLAKGFLCW